MEHFIVAIMYVYIPDGIDEDDDPNKGTFTKPVTSPKAGAQPPAVEACEKGGASCSAAISHSPLSHGAGARGGNRGIPLARITSNNPYIESPLAADANHNSHAERTEL